MTTRTTPDWLPAFELTSRSVATTYSFSTVPRSYGWALCTVNDQTGELAVLSDWGNCSYRWHVNHLGAPSLTHFIAQRASRDYLADKLMPVATEFDPEETVTRLRKQVCELRREGRCTARQARTTYDDLKRLTGERDATAFLNTFLDRDPPEPMAVDPWERLVYSPSMSYLVLRDAILVALVAACRDAVAAHDRGHAPAPP